MYICTECHTERQARPAPEYQPLQHVASDGEHSKRRANCPDCSERVTGHWFEYLTAHELLDQLTEAREELAARAAAFPVQGYHSAADMLERSRVFPAILSDTEAFTQALQYAADIEEVER